MKVLVFTSSYSKRPYMLRQSILNGMNQTYKNMIHAINITLLDDSITTDLLPIYSDLLSDKLSIIYNKNQHSHFNNMNAIMSVQDYNNYDVFVKMDDDDIYKSKYVENVVNFFIEHPEIDIVSTKIFQQLNGYDLYKKEAGYDNLGGNPEGTTYRMPNTFAFTNKAFNIIKDINVIKNHDDFMWRQAWHKEGLKHSEINNQDEIIWHIHGNNWSLPGWLRNPDKYENIIS